MKYLLDTNVLREIGSSKPHPHVDTWIAGVDDVDLAISALSVREMTKGVAKLRKSKPAAAAALGSRITEILNAFGERILPVDRTIAADWGEMLAQSEKHADDAGLAATARAHDLVLVTRNTKDVSSRGVRLLNPFKSPPEQLP
jgi:hypothetical protein